MKLEGPIIFKGREVERWRNLLKLKMSKVSLQRLEALANRELTAFIGFFVEHCDPETIHLCDDSEEDAAFVRRQALQQGEEHPLANSHQTVHWDGYNDQARDKKNTRYLVSGENWERMKSLNAVPYEEGEQEVLEISRSIMKGRHAVVKLFCEGPTSSPFSIPCVQVTDSWYVIHSETILYRPAYAYFLSMKEEEKGQFFRFVHSTGPLDQRGCSADLDRRRVCIDAQHDIVYSLNTQYAGNTMGLKKLSMRLAINKASREGWLCEHMFLMNYGRKGRKTCFAGAYPSACGKTSTAMLPGGRIVGDDIAYFRKIDGKFRGSNAEQGIFGIIGGVNKSDDPLIFTNLKKNQEIIFSNVLRGHDGHPYWLGMEEEIPSEGDNHSGKWKAGQKDKQEVEVSAAHRNARYTMRLDNLDNFDEEGFFRKDGVEVRGILYGGRDSDTTVPIEESPSWREGILLKACTLESETTAATLGAQGVRTPSPMANMDFLSYPLGAYAMNNIRFVEGMKREPKIFSTNYFMKDPSGEYMTSKLAKKVWLCWAEGRIHGEYEAYITPTGCIPLYEDLAILFKELLNEDFTKKDYRYLFTFRCDQWIAKLERTKAFFLKMDVGTSTEIIEAWDETVARLKEIKKSCGNKIAPGFYKEGRDSLSRRGYARS